MRVAFLPLPPAVSIQQPPSSMMHHRRHPGPAPRLPGPAARGGDDEALHRVRQLPLRPRPRPRRRQRPHRPPNVRACLPACLCVLCFSRSLAKRPAGGQLSSSSLMFIPPSLSSPVGTRPRSWRPSRRASARPWSATSRSGACRWSLTKSTSSIYSATRWASRCACLFVCLLGRCCC